MKPLHGDNPTSEQTNERLTYKLTLTDHEGVVIDYEDYKVDKPLLTIDDLVWTYKDVVFR